MKDATPGCWGVAFVLLGIQMNVIFVAYYTRDSLYSEYAQNLAQSLHQFDLTYRIVGINDQGSWDKNTHYKPIFLRQMLDELHPVSLVYVDVDALIHQMPILFDDLVTDPTVDIAAHILDHKKFNHTIPPELLSGTLYLANTSNTRQIVDEWIQACKAFAKIWDQLALDQVLKARNYQGFRNLPEQYTTIYDYMKDVKDPVIVHYQASRLCRTQIRPTIKGIKSLR